MTILTISHRILCMPPPPWQPHMPPCNHACHPPPPAITHALLATMHTPWQPCLPPGNHARPLAARHAPLPRQPCMPPWQPHMPPAATHPWAATHAPPVDRITDTCKNITFPQLRLRAVNMSKTFYRHVTRVLRKVVQNDDYTVRYWSAHGSRFRQI